MNHQYTREQLRDRESMAVAFSEQKEVEKWVRSMFDRFGRVP
jgi:hypothetical protein